MIRISVKILILFSFYRLSRGLVFPENTDLHKGDVCKLKDYKTGTCQEIKQCEHAIKLLKQKRYSELSHCAFNGNTPYVCCPDAKIVVLRVSSYPKSKKLAENLVLCNRTLTHIAENIVGGVHASVGEFPFQVALGYPKKNNTTKYLCGGSLIADDIVITAAHCANKSYFIPNTVKLGRASLVPDEFDDGDGEDIEIQSIKLHPNYSASSRQNDIAVIKLKHPTNFSWPIEKVCLSTDDFDIPINFTVSGFGRNDENTTRRSDWLLKATVNLYPFKECEKLYKLGDKNITDTQVCALGYKGADSCQGDSGGPLSYTDNSGYHLYGIISYGNFCGGSVPGIYTKVNQFLEWIDDVMYEFEQNL